MSRAETEQALRIEEAADFERLLCALTRLNEDLSPGVIKALGPLFDALGPPPGDPSVTATSQFYGRLNQKLASNREVLGRLYASAARAGVTFNYHAKKAISWAVDCRDFEGLEATLRRYCPTDVAGALLAEGVEPVSTETTRELLIGETTKPSKLRKAHERQVAVDVLDSAAGCLVFSLWPFEALAAYFDQGPSPKLTGDYLHGLQERTPEIFERKRSVVVNLVRPESTDQAYLRQRDDLCDWIADEYDALDNYGHLAVVLDVGTGRDVRGWELASDLTLFAERFFQFSLDRLFFRSRDVEAETMAHSPELDREAARFDHIFEGFTYRDLFVLHDEANQIVRLLLLFQKNRSDETLIPCPACRTTRVGGNSYPSFGVKSWECGNLLCPERSIYNRGKRYSFKGLISQAAIEEPANEISPESVGRWRRDVLPFSDDREIVDMLLRHYSMTGDVLVIAPELAASVPLGRTVRNDTLTAPTGGSADFWSSPFFHRYALARALPTKVGKAPALQKEQWAVRHGDSAVVLSELAADQFDRAITSPPYFNAREYSQWPNLYCYLRDMRLLHEQVLRVLKPGAIYAFNIFDYFDNERTITFSLMGQKRLALSSLFVDLFRRIGFEPFGNVVWDKGHVEGKRSFNAGNFSPFYQSPLNCWEHVLLFRKPGAGALGELPDGNRVLRIKPVHKMVRGENRHGHTAPFPIELPAALMDGLPPGALVLDPFGGSGTTAQAAVDLDLRVVLVEQDETYWKLCVENVSEHERNGQQQELF